MATGNPPSLKALGDGVGAATEAHLATTFRRLALDAEGALSGQGYHGLVTHEAHPLANFALLDLPPSEAATERALAHLPGGLVPTSVIHPASRVSAAVEQRLTSAGYACAEVLPGMVVDIDSLAATSIPEGCEFRRVDASLVDDWTGALAEGYGLPPKCARAFAPRTLGPSPPPDASVQLFAVLRDGRVLGTSLLMLADGLAGIYCVATLADERGQGLGAHLTAEPLRLARELGHGVGVLQSSAAGHTVYRRLGFRDFGEVPIFVRVPD